MSHLKEIQQLAKKDLDLYERTFNPYKVEKIKEIHISGLKITYEIIADNLTENAAYILETILIKRFGRQILKTGKLTNMQTGGAWKDSKIIFEEIDEITIKHFEEKFPELIEILSKYPHVSNEPVLKMAKSKKTLLEELRKKYKTEYKNP